MKKNSAFSLIELSIVILAIAALLAGILQGKTIVTKARMRSAQNQTLQSPVAQISNLVAWWETTSERSFDSIERVNGSTISTWYDINPNSVVAINATQSNSSYKPFYKTNIEGGLPMLNFVSGGDYLNIADGTVPYENSSYTIFIVGKFYSCSSICNILTSGTATGSQLNAFQYSSSGNILNNWQSSNVSASKPGIVNTHIYTFIYYNISGIGRKIYVDGVRKVINGSIVTRAGGRSSNYIGSTSSSTGLDGYLGEIIIFDRNLKIEERQGIEKYLSLKWGISLS
ncbi:MAG: type II secretion system protein [Proteobacteria bacterium]|nr:type II secretion system protein [Pseudomonadota bacterium]